MTDDYGSDFITITDENGIDYELEILATVEYNGAQYLAVIPAADSEELELEVLILRNEEEDGEPLLVTIDDDAEFEAVSDLIMDLIYEEEE